MDNALVLNLSNQMVMRRNMEVVANNIANMNTTGFKRESAVFQEYAVKIDRQTDFGTRRQPISFVRDVMAVHDMSDGPMKSTGNTFDLAINGPGFFAVNTPEGERYTRNGNFGLDDTGRLVTTSGHPVLDDGGAEIVFAPQETGITFGRDGSIATDQGVRGRIQLVDFANPQQMDVVGDSLWKTTEAPAPSEISSVVQGMLEQSNVQPVVEMTRMIETMRSYQISTELMNANDELSRKAVQRLGETRA